MGSPTPATGLPRIFRITGRQSFPLLVFVVSRLAIGLVAFFALVTAEQSLPPHGLALVNRLAGQWDGANFLRIAAHGYDTAADAAFYPLYPGLVAGTSWLTGVPHVISGVVLSLTACGVAFWLLYGLAESLLGAAGARRAVVYLAVAPMSLFLQVVYSEALYLMLSLAVFLLASRGRYGLGGVAAGLAALTRATGAVLFPVLAFMTWKATHSVRRVAIAMSGAVLFVIYPLILRHAHLRTWSFVHAERYWQRHPFTIYGPLYGLWRSLVSVWDALRQLTGQVAHADQATNPERVAVINIEYFLFFLALAVLAVVAWRRIGTAYGLYAVLTLCLPLSAPNAYYPLQSIPRFGLITFPIYLALADLGKRSWLNSLILCTSVVLLTTATVQWAHGEWVS